MNTDSCNIHDISSLAKNLKPTSLAGSRAYARLLKLAREDGQREDSFRLLLILINAHPELTAHSRIFENLSHILDMPPVQSALSCNPAWGEQVAIWKDLCRWVVSNKTRFAQDDNLKGFVYEDPVVEPGSEPKPAKHPLNRNGRGFTRHGVCSCLFNRHESVSSYTPRPEVDTVAYRYLCLQAQLLVAYLDCRYDTSELVAMESHTGTEECRRIPTASESVSRAVRHLNGNAYAPLLLNLHTERSPDDFYQRLPSVTLTASVTDGLDETEAKKVKKEGKLSLKYLQNYFAAVDNHFPGKVKPSSRRKQSSRKTDGSRTLTGYIHVVTGVWIKQPIKEEDEDIGYDPADLIMVSDEPGDCDGKESERSGLAPDDGRTLVLKLYSPEEFGGAMMRSKQAEMAKRMAAQKFSWDYEVLTTTELRCLWALLNKKISLYLALDAPTAEQTNTVQGALMLKIMLLLGQDLESVRTLHISRDGNTDMDGLVFHPADQHKSAQWQLPSLTPQYKTELSENQQRLGRVKADQIFLPDMAGIGDEIMSYLKQSGRSLRRVFSPEKKTTEILIRELLSQIGENWLNPVTMKNEPLAEQRITPTKIRNALRIRLRQQSGDPAIEWLVSTQLDYRNEPRLHYTNLSDHQINAEYIRAARRLLKDMGETVPSYSSFNISSSGNHGARFVASMDSIKKLVSNLAIKLAVSPSHYDKSGIIEYHNWLTFHVWLLQSLCTSMRAINNPNAIVVALADRKQSKHVGLSDKENPRFADKARLVYLPELLRMQIDEYRNHVDSIKRELGIARLFNNNESQAIRELFVLDNNHEPFQITLTWLEKQMADLGIPLPGNFHRGFLRTELIARGCTGQVVDAFLGHSNLGESPFFTYSTMDYMQWQSNLLAVLEPLLKECGITFRKSCLVRR